MDGDVGSPAIDVQSGRSICSAFAPVEAPELALGRLAAMGGTDGFCLVMLFVAATADMAAIARLAEATFGAVPVIGCSTAGEIAGSGYLDGHIVAVGFRSDAFIARTVLIGDLYDLNVAEIGELTVRMRGELAHQRPDWTSEFSCLLTDGLARREDQLMSALRFGLGNTPLFGGSAGDGLDFRRTAILSGGEVHENAAVLTLMRTRCPVRVFNIDHFETTDVKMVVTSADPERRIVHELNAEPAATEYARLVGLVPEQLSPFVFASYPVVVSVGGKHHVRAIRRDEGNGDLSFFSAIDEGLVLTLARPMDMVAHLEGALAELACPARPEAIIAFDCVYRRLEADERQSARLISRLLAEHDVVGFNTYGEQFNSVHVNQTFTGIAIYPPLAAPP